MSGIYVFYPDRFWFRQLLMNGAILVLLGCFRKKRHILRRTLLWSAPASLIQTILLLGTGSRQVFDAATFFVLWPLMVWLFLREDSIRLFLGDLAAALVMLLSLGGLLTALELRFPGRGLLVPGVLLAVPVNGLLLRWLYEQARLQRRMYALALEGPGGRVRCQGFLDTGNRLVLPGEEALVHIVSQELLDELTRGEEPAALVRYHSLGRAEGSLEVFWLNMGPQGGELSPVLAAKGPAELFAGRPYRVILNGETPLSILVERRNGM